MRILFLVWCLVFGATAPASACPEWQYPALRGMNLTGDSLRDTNAYLVIAGGDARLDRCGFAHRGHVGARPDFEFHLTAMDGVARLVMWVEAACDAVLLVNSTTGHWHFDDNSHGARDPRLDFFAGLAGTFDVWIGTAGPETCPATLYLQSL